MLAEHNDAKKVFWKCGACSHALACLLNREFGHPDGDAERASDLLAGGVVNTGHQCGMLWGACQAAGAEAFRRHPDPAQATAVAIVATQYVLKSYVKRTGTPDCREVTGCNLESPFGLGKLMVTTILGGFVNSPCFNLIEKWAPEALASAEEGLTHGKAALPLQAMSCASEVAKKMGASDEEMVTVAGFAGGMGLSGNACGALSAAIWMATLAWCRKNPGKTPPYFGNPWARDIIKAFRDATSSTFRCDKITGRHFASVHEHTAFVKSGGCAKLIDVLVQSAGASIAG